MITNAASKNAESKEITRLREIIAKMKKGEAAAEVDNDDDDAEDA